MVDRIKPLKLESPLDGTQYDPTPTELDPQEDYIATKGISFQDSENIVIESIGGELRFRDTKISPITLNELINLIKSGINFNFSVINSNEEITIPSGQQMIVHGRLKIYGKLSIKGDLILKNW